MARVIFTNQYGHNVIKEMEHIPRKGDKIPLFYRPFPSVTQVVWFPEEMITELAGKGIDVLIAVE